MFKRLKINTAIIICVAFLFRLLSLSYGFISPPNEGNALLNTGCKCAIEKGTSLIGSEKDSKSIYTDVVFSEEDADDENEQRSFTPVLLECFSGIDVYSIGSHVRAITPSNKHFVYNSSQRHLEYGVFRI